MSPKKHLWNWFFCRQNWVFPFVQRLQTYQIEIRSKNSRLDHLQLLKVKIRIRHQVIQDVLRLLRIQFCHQFMNSKYHKFLYQPRYRSNFIFTFWKWYFDFSSNFPWIYVNFSTPEQGPNRWNGSLFSPIIDTPSPAAPIGLFNLSGKRLKIFQKILSKKSKFSHLVNLKKVDSAMIPKIWKFRDFQTYQAFVQSTIFLLTVMIATRYSPNFPMAKVK